MKHNAQVVAFALQKGGTGKTTTVANTAYILAELGKRVAVFDFDPQGNLSLAFGVDPDNLKFTIMDVIQKNCNISKIKFRKLGVDIYPANDQLSRLDMIIIKHANIFPKPGNVLEEIINTVRDQYDYILIDLPPSLGLLAINGLTAADGVVIPLQTEYFALSGLKRMLITINEIIIPEFNSRLKVLGILPTMHDNRLNLSVGVLERVKRITDKTPYRVFSAVIARATKFGLAPTKGVPAVKLYRNDPIIQEYREFVKELFGVE